MSAIGHAVLRRGRCHSGLIGAFSGGLSAVPDNAQARLVPVRLALVLPADTVGARCGPTSCVPGRQLLPAPGTRSCRPRLALPGPPDSSTAECPTEGAHRWPHPQRARRRAVVGGLRGRRGRAGLLDRVARAAVAALRQLPRVRCRRGAPLRTRATARKLRPAGSRACATRPSCRSCRGASPTRCSRAAARRTGASSRPAASVTRFAGCRCRDLGAGRGVEPGRHRVRRRRARRLYRGTSFVPFGAVADGGSGSRTRRADQPCARARGGLGGGVAAEWLRRLWVGVHVDLPLAGL